MAFLEINYNNKVAIMSVQKEHNYKKSSMCTGASMSSELQVYFPMYVEYSGVLNYAG